MFNAQYPFNRKNVVQFHYVNVKSKKKKKTLPIDSDAENDVYVGILPNPILPHLDQRYIESFQHEHKNQFIFLCCCSFHQRTAVKLIECFGSQISLPRSIICKIKNKPYFSGFRILTEWFVVCKKKYNK